jgi:hypothetical protein
MAIQIKQTRARTIPDLQAQGATASGRNAYQSNLVKRLREENRAERERHEKRQRNEAWVRIRRPSITPARTIVCVANNGGLKAIPDYRSRQKQRRRD